MSILSDLLAGKDKDKIKAKAKESKKVNSGLTDEEYAAIDLSEFKFNENQIKFLRHLVPCDFNYTAAAFKTGVSRICVYKWRKDYPEFDKACIDYEEIIVEIARATVTRAAKLGDVKAAQFLLEKLDARYKRRVDLTSDDKPLPSAFHIIIDKE